MKADKSKMFAVSVKTLPTERELPFPLFLYLQLNDRMVHLRLPGSVLGEPTKNSILQKQDQLWVPLEFREAFDTFFANPNVATNAITEIPSEAANNDAEISAKEENTSAENDEPRLVSLDDLPQRAKEILKGLATISNRNEQDLEAAAKKCQKFAEDILSVQAEQDPMARELLQFRSFQLATDHSVFVGSLATVLSAAAGKTDLQELSFLAEAGAIHDTGAALASFDNYSDHAHKGAKLFEESDGLDETVKRIAREHHESGENKKVLGLSRFLQLADHFELIRLGEVTGESMPPEAAFRILREQQPFGVGAGALLESAFANDTQAG